MRYVIGFLLGIMFTVAVAVYEDVCSRAPRGPNRTAPSLRRIGTWHE